MYNCSIENLHNCSLNKIEMTVPLASYAHFFFHQIYVIVPLVKYHQYHLTSVYRL